MSPLPPSPRFALLVAVVAAVGLNAQAPGGSIAGRVALPDGGPLAGAQVVAARVTQPIFDRRAVTARAVTAWDGRYELTSLPAGVYHVVATPPPDVVRTRVARGEPALVPTVYPGMREDDAGTAVTVFANLPTEGIDIWLLPGPQRFSVSGRVSWPNDVAAENVVIEYGGPALVRGGIWTVPEPGDLFAIDGLPQGPLVMLARADSSRGPLVGLAATHIGVAPAEDVRLTLDVPGAVEGRVIFDGARPPGALSVAAEQRLLKLSPLAPATESRVDDQGRFRIEGLLGEYTFAVQGPGAGWRVTRAQRDGRALDGGRLAVGRGVVRGVVLTVSAAAPRSSRAARSR